MLTSIDKLNLTYVSSNVIENIVENHQSFPFYFEQVGSILLVDNPIMIDLFFMEEINGLVIKNYSPFIFPESESGALAHAPIKEFLKIEKKEDLFKRRDLGLNKEFSKLLLFLLEELNSKSLGIQITKPSMNLCPSLHHDKLPLRIVQCLDGPGTTLVSSNGETIETEENDLIFLKGEMWKSDVGPIVHKSPDSSSLRTLFRIDFLD